MSETPPRVILGEGATRDHIDDAMAERGCRLTNVVPPSSSHPGQLIFTTGDRQGTLFVVEDTRLGLVYLTGQGDGLAQELNALRERLPSYDDTALSAQLARPDDEAAYARALGAVALMAGPEPTDAQLEAVRGGLGHSSAAVRSAALVAITYAPWPALGARIAELATGDPDATVRANAARLLEALYPRGTHDAR